MIYLHVIELPCINVTSIKEGKSQFISLPKNCSETRGKSIMVIITDYKLICRGNLEFFQSSCSVPSCPLCCESLKYKDFHKRIHRQERRQKYHLDNCRLKYNACKRIRNELTDAVVPYKHTVQRLSPVLSLMSKNLSLSTMVA